MKEERILLLSRIFGNLDPWLKRKVITDTVYDPVKLGATVWATGEGMGIVAVSAWHCLFVKLEHATFESVD